MSIIGWNSSQIPIKDEGVSLHWLLIKVALNLLFILGIWPLPFFCVSPNTPSFLPSPACVPVSFLPVQYHSYSSQRRGCRHPPGRSGHHGDCAHLGWPAHWGHHAHHRCGLVPVSVLQTLLLSPRIPCFPCRTPNEWALIAARTEL